MKLLVFVLNDIDLLEDLLKEFKDNDIKGATILNSTGMAHTLAASNDEYLIGSIRRLLDMERNESRTILVLLKKEQLLVAKAAIEKVCGDLSAPDSGIMFTVPVDFCKGICAFEEEVA